MIERMTEKQVHELADTVREAAYAIESRVMIAAHNNALTALTNQLLALQTRVAELEAQAAGMTGTPTHEGRYWCQFGLISYHSPMEWAIPYDGISHHWCCNQFGVYRRAIATVTRYWRLPGETYIEVKP